jgi:hypothetical protein
MNLIFVLVIAGILGYFIGRSRTGKRINQAVKRFNIHRQKSPSEMVLDAESEAVE